MSNAVGLLPPNSTAFERALIGVLCADLTPAPVGDTWNAETCPAELLPWLAWGLSLDDWKPYWSERIKRARIASAIEVQRQKGTASSVRKVVESFGGAVEIREWWEHSPPGKPHTFDLTLILSGNEQTENSAKFVEDVIGEVGRVKPVRSHFTFTQGAQFESGIGVVAEIRPVAYRRLQFLQD